MFEVAEAAVKGGAMRAAPVPKSRAVVLLARSKGEQASSNPSVLAAASLVVL